VVKRLVVGRALRSQQLNDTLLPKWLALPVFASDPLSSVAYATEEIVLVLAAGGGAYLAFSKWIAALIAALLVIVVLSYRQTCFAYPNGGGAFAVSLDNFGENAALVAAAALLVDYVMTVAVSVVAGVVGITSAVPSMHAHAVALSVGFTVLLLVANLRGVRESGRAFAIPTYLFVSLTYLMFLVAAARAATGTLNDASTAAQQLQRTAHVGGTFTLLLLMRAFASGCTALTGVEAISNGVPAFRKPKAGNAAGTLVIMGVLSVTMFAGITALALGLHAHAQADGNPSVIAQVAASVFGGHALLFYVYQAATAGILILAANTAFNGFPVLASILAQHSYLPRQMHNRGDRLVFSNGIILLTGCAVALIIGFDANVDQLIHLYIIGVFTSFTLSQAGMVRHWNRLLRNSPASGRNRMRASRAMNLTGAVATGVVLIVVLLTKVVEGAWLAILAMMLLFLTMKGISRHYRSVADELDVRDLSRPMLPARNHALILVSRLHLPTVRAIAYAKAIRPDSLRAVTVQIDETETSQLLQQWAHHEVDVPLVIIDSPYREVTKPLLDYIRRLRGPGSRDVVTIFLPEYILGHWWEQLLHNQSALRLKARLLFEPGVMVTSVPWQLRSTQAQPQLVAELRQPPAVASGASSAVPSHDAGHPG
jgi:amino acid transporter